MLKRLSNELWHSNAPLVGDLAGTLKQLRVHFYSTRRSRTARLRNDHDHLDRYGHLMPGSEVEARAMLDAYLDDSQA